MDTEEVLVTKLIEMTIEKGVSFFTQFLKKSKSSLDLSISTITTGSTIHIKKSYNFARSISVYKLNDKLDLIENSIQLKIGNQDRRFYSRSQEKSLEEIDLLLDQNHHIILGDPGAGKTTTLKRLVNKFYQIIFSDKSEITRYTFPIVVRLSEIKIEENLLIHLCHQLGILYEANRKEIPYTETEDVYEDYFDHKLKENITRKRQIKKDKVTIIYEYKIGNYPLKFGLSEYLDNMNCILFFDGLDEINYQLKETVFNEIKDLSNTLRNSKIILTARYLQEIPSFKQFNVNEIKPLDNNQKKEIARLWLRETELFFKKLNLLPYKDIADRPLFLTFLLRLFNVNNDELPEQAVDVYRQIILLAIREWDYDKEQDIRRYSKYKSLFKFCSINV